MTKLMTLARKLGGIGALATTLAIAAPAFAQDPALPLKKAPPLLDKRSLSIPGKLPVIRQADPAPRKARDLRASKPVPAPVTAPTPADDGPPGYGDIKRTAGPGCRPMRSTDTVQFEFKGADIKDVVSAISKTMCKNFIITQKVRSQKFDILSPTPITVAEAWRAFMSALEANDFTVVQAGKYYKIIQATDATRAPVPMYREPTRVPVDDRMVTKIWKPKHVSDLNSVVNYLNIFKSQRGQIHPFLATGVIVVTDYGSSIDRLEEILAELDVAGVSERLHVVPVEFATASEISDKLGQVFEPNKGAAGKPAAANPVKRAPNAKPTAAAPTEDGPGGLSVSKIIPDDRTNSLIIIASEESFRQIMALKKKLDVPGESGDGLVHVLRLRHADAEELASTLSSLASGAASTQGRRGAAPATAAKPGTRAPGTAASAALFQGDVKITADKATNSLVITASKLDLQSVKRVIAQLDVPRYQVFVEAVILEVSMKRDRSLGVSWYGGVPIKLDGKDSPILFGSQPAKDLSAFSTALNPVGLANLLGLAGAIRGPTLAGSDSIVTGGIPSIGVVLQALQSSNDINVVSTPHLLTLDNEEAEIQVSEKRPFPAGLSLGGLGGLGGLANQAGLGQAAGALGNIAGLGLGSVAINREDVGLTLKLKPQINDQEYVRLEIDQELSDVAGLDQVTQQTITSKRAAKTVVVVRDQDSVVIGGLVRDRESEDESKVPLLGDLPLIGWLFRRQQKLQDKVNLLLVITPYIIRGPDDFRKIYERKMAERKEFVDRFYGAEPEYRANIDWSRKTGPLARIRADIRDELMRAENGGPGLAGEEVIRADDGAPIEMPAGDAAGDAGSGSEGTPAVPGPGELAPPPVPAEPAIPPM